MNVLIAEDDNEKCERIRVFLEATYITDDIIIAKSLQSGLRLVLKGDIDLVLLDMTMPNFDRSLHEEGGRPHHFAGREILRQMNREGVRCPVVIITQFGRFGEESEEVSLTELEAELASRFPDYIGTVSYRSNVDGWKNQLKSLLSNIMTER